MSNIPSIREKCTGALIASAIGDALGWPYEFRSRNSATTSENPGDFFSDWARNSGGRYWNHKETILAGEYSDDTQMILAVSRSIISGSDWKDRLAFIELPYWLEYERGGGSALKKAAKSYKANKKPWDGENAREYFEAGGNGAAMRILPHVIAHYDSSNDMELLMNDVFLNSIISHGHPRAILGATCYAFALDAILRKKTTLLYGELIQWVIDGTSVWGAYRGGVAPNSWNKAKDNLLGDSYISEWYKYVDDMVDKLHYIDKSLKKGLLVNDRVVLTELKCFEKENGAGDIAILAALYLASKYANNPILGIKTAAYTVGTDTDTIASITGGLLGMLCGMNWIPSEWRIVQDYRCLCDIAEILLSNNMKLSSKRISDINSNNTNVSSIQNSPIGKSYIVDSIDLPCGKNGQVIITKVCTLLGQTIYLKQYTRRSRSDDISDNTVSTASAQLNMFDKVATLDIAKATKYTNNTKLGRMSFKKVVQIAEQLLQGKDCEYIANQFKIDTEIVHQIHKMLH